MRLKRLLWIIGFAFFSVQVFFIHQILFYRIQLEDTSSQLQGSVHLIHKLQTEVLALTEFINRKEFTALEITTVETTGYAPLDPQAVEGMCYQGNPNITASGEITLPGITIAAPPHIPFGSWVWLEGLGWRRVDDRGGRIKGNKIDICFPTRKEALEWGRQTRTMVIPVWEENPSNSAPK